MNTVTITTSLSAPAHSQWGPVQQSVLIAPGIWQVSTASHGGVVVARELNARIPAEAQAACRYSQAAMGQYEEDCDWAVPFAFLADYIREHSADPCVLSTLSECVDLETIRQWHPELLPLLPRRRPAIA